MEQHEHGAFNACQHAALEGPGHVISRANAPYNLRAICHQIAVAAPPLVAR